MPPYGFDALLFDVDGTLADTERDGHRPAFNAAFREAGLDWEWSVEDYGRLLAVTGGKERIRHYLRLWRPPWKPPADPEAWIADLHRRKTAHYQQLLRTGAIPLRPGVVRLLRQARAAGIRLGIATTTLPENVLTLLECSRFPELAGWFEVIAAGDMVAAKKPAPDVFQWALDRLGLPASACVVLEDSDNGVRAARASGLPTVLVTVSTYTRDQDFSGAALVVDHLGEPGLPVEVLAGTREGDGPIDLATLDALHRRARGGLSRDGS